MLVLIVLALPCAAIYGILFGVPPAGSHSNASMPVRPSTSPTWLIARYGWCLLLTAALCFPLLKGEAQKHWRFFRDIRLSMVFQNLGILILIVTCAAGLRFGLPFLDRSWLYLFPLSDGSAININLLPAFIRYFGLLFVVLLVLNLPELAHYEERKYRSGTKDWKHGLRRSLRFGLAHCWVGIPLYAGLALSVGGVWFTYQYFKGGVERSTAHHLTYNLIAATLLVIYLIAARIVF